MQNKPHPVPGVNIAGNNSKGEKVYFSTATLTEKFNEETLIFVIARSKG
ncbi:MAG: hypothetical protein ABII75_01890 [Candidatus Omnitrophota bacterium]